MPKGTRDFSPGEMLRRDYIFNVIRMVFRKYGFLPIETPAIENLSTLTGKYGEEGDQLIFKILNSGNYLADATPEDFTDSKKLLPKISGKALRYDLTVPFARFVVLNQHNLAFPFKRFQIQPVWRADRPQKGRYREFFQCDGDIIGSNSLFNEAELIKILDEVFTILGIQVNILINNRKILAGLSEFLGIPERFHELTNAIDKLDKVELSQIVNDLSDKGFPEEALKKLQFFLSRDFPANPVEKLDVIEEIIGSTPSGTNGIEELHGVLKYLNNYNINSKVLVDFSLARGLNYYTGIVIEVRANNVKMGSLSGGGRYDNLTGIFGLQGVSGVGISFGADRIYDVMDELSLFPAAFGIETQVLFANFGDLEVEYCITAAELMRAEGIRVEIYPDPSKIKKQMAYADQKKIPYVVLAGSEEIEAGIFTIKSMQNGTQLSMSIEDLTNKLKEEFYD